MAEDTAEGLKDAIRVDSEQPRGHVDEVVRSSVEETLKELLRAEAEQLVRGGALRALTGANRYPRRALRTQPRDEGWRGDLEGSEVAHVALRGGDHRSVPPARVVGGTSPSVEQALVEMYLAGVSVRAGRSLGGVQLIIADAGIGLVEAAAELFPQAQWQHCGLRL